MTFRISLLFVMISIPTLCLSQTEQPYDDGWMQQQIPTSITAEHVSPQNIEQLHACPFCSNISIRQNHYTLDGNFYANAPFASVKEFFHGWMIQSGAVTLLHINLEAENQYHAVYTLTQSDQHLTLALDSVHDFYRFELDSRARDEKYFAQQQEYFQKESSYF